jgi:hypothetical protein
VGIALRRLAAASYMRRLQYLRCFSSCQLRTPRENAALQVVAHHLRILSYLTDNPDADAVTPRQEIIVLCFGNHHIAEDLPATVWLPLPRRQVFLHAKKLVGYGELSGCFDNCLQQPIVLHLDAIRLIQLLNKRNGAEERLGCLCASIFAPSRAEGVVVDRSEAGFFPG